VTSQKKLRCVRVNGSHCAVGSAQAQEYRICSERGKQTTINPDVHSACSAGDLAMQHLVTAVPTPCQAVCRWKILSSVSFSSPFLAGKIRTRAARLGTVARAMPQEVCALLDAPLAARTRGDKSTPHKSFITSVWQM
jgi:hypothetical protein